MYFSPQTLKPGYGPAVNLLLVGMTIKSVTYSR